MQRGGRGRVSNVLLSSAAGAAVCGQASAPARPSADGPGPRRVPGGQPRLLLMAFSCLFLTGVNDIV